MMKFYIKILNNILVKNLLYIVIFIVFAVNIFIRIFPSMFIHDLEGSYYVGMTQPIAIYTYCDVYLLLLFILLLFFYIGIDFNNSMEEISLTVSSSVVNKFTIRKLITILVVYFFLYAISFINIYTIYLQFLSHNRYLLPLKKIIFYSFCTNVFIISLSLFILLLTKDISISTVIISSYYLIEEHLWRCKISGKYGILGHIYHYEDYKPNEIIKIKLWYILISIVLLFLFCQLSKRKRYSCFNKIKI